MYNVDRILSLMIVVLRDYERYSLRSMCTLIRNYNKLKQFDDRFG